MLHQDSYLCVSAVLAILIAAAGASAQQVLYVDAHAAPAGDCLSWATACRELQTALNLAQVGDQIWLADGVYRPTQLTDPKDARSATFALVNGVAIYGGFAGGEASLDERNPALNEARLTGDLLGDDGMGDGHDIDNAYHVVTSNGVDATTLVDGVTIQRGNADGSCCGNDRGGGVFNDGGSPAFINCAFRSHQALSGGAVHSSLGHIVLNDCVFTLNSATTGGAVYIAIDTPATIEDCSFINNTASLQGGAIQCSLDSEPVITNCSFRNNSAPLGGAMMEDGSAAIVQECRFEGNTATGGGTGGRGGAVYGGGEPGAKFTDCTFIANSAGTDGGAARTGGRQDFVRCRFLGNRADARGGALHVDSTDPLISNCLFSGNLAQLFGGAISLNATTMIIGSSTFSRNEAGPINDSGNCCGAHPSAGCTDEICETAVCMQDRFCCDMEWDETCADRAGDLLECDCGGEPGVGGAIYLTNESNLTVENSILWRNSDSTGFGESAQITAEGQNMKLVRYNTIQGLTGMFGGTGNIDDNPLFVNSRGPDNVPGTEDDNLRLQPDSPAINAGDPDYDAKPGDIDLDHRPRVQCGRIDMGAYEFGFADVGCDLVLDLTDFAQMAACVSDPDGGLTPECELFDSDADNDADLQDLAAFQNLFVGVGP